MKFAPITTRRGKPGKFNAFRSLSLIVRARNLLIWRRERDSNPRNGFPFSGFQDHRHRPLGHPSASNCPGILRCFSSSTAVMRQAPGSVTIVVQAILTSKIPHYDRAMADSRSSLVVPAFAPIAGGWFTMGTALGYEDDRPPHSVFVNRFSFFPFR